MMVKAVFVAGIGLIAVLGSTEGGAAQTSARVPAGLLRVAALDPYTFAMYLADSRVPAGLEVRQADRPQMGARRIDVSGTESIPIGQLVQAFNNSHSGYQAEMKDRVLLIRPNEHRAVFLENRLPKPARLRVRGVMDAARNVFSALDPRINAPGGRAGSTIGGLADDDHGEHIDISVDGDNKEVLEVLDEVAEKAPGHVWFVATSGNDIVQIAAIGFIHQGRTTTELPISPIR